MDNKKNGVFIFLGICVLLAGGMIGSSLSEVADSMNNQQDTEINDSYRVIVQDGNIYMYDTITGQVWKKKDNPDSKWEEFKGPYDD